MCSDALFHNESGWAAIPGGPAAWQDLWAPENEPAGSTVAICAVGQLRTLPYSWVLENWAAALLEPLRAALFLDVSTKEKADQTRTSRADLNRVVHRLRPVGVRVRDDSRWTYHRPHLNRTSIRMSVKQR